MKIKDKLKNVVLVVTSEAIINQMLADKDRYEEIKELKKTKEEKSIFNEKNEIEK